MGSHQQQPVVHSLNAGAQQILRIRAAERYSMQRIAVMEGQSYNIRCDAGQRWVDMVIWASPKGYPNPLARLFGMRVHDARCFCLCGAYNDADTDAFAIGTDHTIAHVPINGTLSFFANDVHGYEWNNWGSIDITVTRLQ
ncbi:hypothetical protein GCM10023093_09030 [Nemorincola caseinilytica]|uniref:DUF1036 domain-containing protein n=1 Tax=Nemorincola caseinilytica TaxID=2054315 RepID=A0ABP8NA16_9BACT